MFTIPTMIPAAVRSRMQRAEARRGYAELSDSLNETIDDLHTAGDHDERAALLDFAAQVTGRLAELHTAAWGPDADTAGRPLADALASQAALMGQVAATERAVIGAIAWPDTRTASGDEHAAELLTWTLLAHTAEPGQRAIYLRRLRDLAAERLGDTAAEILVVLAEVEEFRATGAALVPARPRYVLPRVLVGAVLALLAVIAVVPGLDAGGGRVVLLLCVLAAAYVGVGVFARVTQARTQVGRS